MLHSYLLINSLLNCKIAVFYVCVYVCVCVCVSVCVSVCVVFVDHVDLCGAMPMSSGSGLSDRSFLTSRIKPVQKVEGMTNGLSLGGVPLQSGGLSDISAQVPQYQQVLAETHQRT